MDASGVERAVQDLVACWAAHDLDALVARLSADQTQEAVAMLIRRAKPRIVRSRRASARMTIPLPSLAR